MSGPFPDLPVLVAGLAVIAAGLGAWAFLSWQTARLTRARRIAMMAGKASKARSTEAQVRDTARSIHNRRRVTNRRAFSNLMRQAGVRISPAAFAAICVTLAAVIGAAAYGSGLSPLPAVLAGAGLGPGLGLLYLNRRRARRRVAMEKEFPGAMDIIVRGMKSGLPLGDCLKIAARDIPDPLRSEFARLVEQQSMGMPMADAVDRFATRVPLQEANFFSIVISLQTRTGGRLSESLDNLVKVLRARVQLRAKIRSMSSEAKASGMIIGALPPVVATLVYFTSPDYIGLLFTETIGNVVLLGSAIWMTIGVLVMKKMIAFDY